MGEIEEFDEIFDPSFKPVFRRRGKKPKLSTEERLKRLKARRILYIQQRREARKRGLK